MDNVTHSLIGVALARAGLGRVSPLAMPTLVLAANAPDIDVLAYTKGSYAMLALRRGATHGPLGLIVLSFIVTLVVLAYDHVRRRRAASGENAARAAPLFGLALLGTLTHAPMDWMNTWGVRLLAPFVDRWFYGDTLFIIDPWIWLTLATVAVPFTRTRSGQMTWVLLAIVTLILMLSTPQVPRVVSLVWIAAVLIFAITAAVAQRRGSLPGERWARGALACVAVYIAVMLVADRSGRAQVLHAARERGFTAEKLMVAPVPANPFGASIVAQTTSAYQLGTLHWLRRRRVAWSDSIPFGPRDETVFASLRHPAVRDFLRWSRFPYVRVHTTAQGTTVRWADARYPGQRGGGMSGVDVPVEVNPQSNQVR